MLVKRLRDCAEIVAGDRTRLRELLHPERDPIAARYSLAVAWLEPGQVSLKHQLKQTEVYYLVHGRTITDQRPKGDTTSTTPVKLSRSLV